MAKGHNDDVNSIPSSFKWLNQNRSQKIQHIQSMKIHHLVDFDFGFDLIFFGFLSKKDLH